MDCGAHPILVTRRSTFEGSLKAVFAEFFYREKEGAYANIVLQSGFTSAIGFIFSYKGIPCFSLSRFCIQYYDSSFHDVLVMELVVIMASLSGVGGYFLAVRSIARTNIPNIVPSESEVEAK